VASYWQIDTPLTVGQIAGTVLVLIGVTLVSAEAKG
jgi:hypothetical protein